MNRFLMSTALALALGLTGSAWAAGEKSSQSTGAQGAGSDMRQQSGATGDRIALDQRWQGAMGDRLPTDVVGMDVVTQDGETIGDIEGVVFTRTGDPYAVVSVGGFLGIGEKNVAVPVEQLRTSSEDDQVLMMSESAAGGLESSPAYDESQYQPAPSDPSAYDMRMPEATKSGSGADAAGGSAGTGGAAGGGSGGSSQ